MWTLRSCKGLLGLLLFWRRASEDIIVERRWPPLGIQHISPQAIHMLREVWADRTQHLITHSFTLPLHLCQRVTHREDIVEDHTVCDEVVVFDDLALDITIIGTNRPIASKC